MFDVNKPETLSDLRKWWSGFKEKCPVPDEEAEDFCCIVVGNKIDQNVNVENGNGHGLGLDENGNERQISPRKKVSLNEAHQFIEELIPRATVPETANANLIEEDPFLQLSDEGWPDSNGHAKGVFVKPSFSFTINSHTDGGSRARSQSINIERSISSSSHPYAKIGDHGGLPKSRSSDIGQLESMGTVSTMRSGLSIYHTPASSFFDSFESFASSPRASSPPSLHSRESTQSLSVSPRTPVRQVPRRAPSSSSLTSSAPTITPSLFLRTRASTSATSSHSPTESGQDGQPLEAVESYTVDTPPAPDRRPRIFWTSAKTGEGISELFEYVAKRVVMRHEYTEEREARELHLRQSTDDTIRLSSSSSKGTLSRWKKNTPCCGT